MLARMHASNPKLERASLRAAIAEWMKADNVSTAGAAAAAAVAASTSAGSELGAEERIALSRAWALWADETMKSDALQHRLRTLDAEYVFCVSPLTSLSHRSSSFRVQIRCRGSARFECTKR